jgi:hypothetical protein
MTDLHTFALLLADVAPRMEVLGGRIFLDRFGRGQTALLQDIAKFEDAKAAQQCINMVPIDELLNWAVGDWSTEDPMIPEVVDVFRRSWLAMAKARYGSCDGLSVEVLKDESVGDVIVRLNQS